MSARGVFVRAVVAVCCALCSLVAAELSAEERPSRGGSAVARTTASPAVCVASTSLPPNVRVERHLLPRVEKILERSPTFREQCRRLAAAPWVHVGVKLNPRVFDTRGYRAVSVIQRPRPNLMIALVTLEVLTDPAVWLAHELEHVLEQVDNVDLEALADRTRGVWRVGSHMFETKRAIAVGAAVAEEVRNRSAHHDRDVPRERPATLVDDHNSEE